MGREAPDRPADDPPRSGEGIEKVRYKGEDGKQDLILILTKPKWTPKHWTGKFYMTCLQGDNPACCKHFGDPPPTSTAYIIHVAQRKGRGDWKILGIPKIWGFGDDKWAQYQALLLDNCDNDFKKLQKMLIQITCQKAAKQKLFIAPYTKKDVKVTREMMVEAKEQKEMFIDDIVINESDVIRSLADIKAGGDGTGDGGSSNADPDDAPEREPGEEDNVPFDDNGDNVASPEAPSNEESLDDLIENWDS